MPDFLHLLVAKSAVVKTHPLAEPSQRLLHLAPIMYLRKFKRRKNGKIHISWGLVESHRVAGKVRQRLVASLGQLSDAECAPYVQLLCQLSRDLRQDNHQPDLFDEPLAISPGKVQAERVLDFGDAWMGLCLWRLLELDQFFADHISDGREQVPWDKMIAWSVIARFCAPFSELATAESFAHHSALSDLLAVNPARINPDRLYRTLDQFLKHKAALMKFLATRYADLFQSSQDLVLYDLTSTYLEGQAEQNPKARRGYSRDGRSDAKQVVIALVTTREGLPLACEVFRGNRHDSTTLRTICTVMTKRFGAMERVWVMDRGIASEENLSWLRDQGAHYLVGTPKSQLRLFEKQLLEASWTEAREGVEVVLAKHPEGGSDTYVLCRSQDRAKKERAMVERFAVRLEEGLKALEKACSRKRSPLRDKLILGKRLGVLLSQCSRAKGLFEISVKEKAEGQLELVWRRQKQESWSQRSAGCYLLRSSLPSPLSAEEQWQAYIQLTEVESAFRCVKSELGVRPIHHQKPERVQAHIQICFLALCLRRTLGLRLEQWGLGSGVGKVMEELRGWKQLDVILPLAGSDKTLRRRLVATPSPWLKILLQRLVMPAPKSGSLLTKVKPM